MFEGKHIFKSKLQNYSSLVTTLGRKCNKRCKNSIEILMKQEQSKKVNLTKQFEHIHSFNQIFFAAHKLYLWWNWNLWLWKY